jgi:type I restriction enzyme S subunit
MASEYRDSGIPFLRSQDVTPHFLDLRDVKFVSEEFHRRIAKSSLSPGDVVIVRTGKPGSAAVIPSSLPIANCSDLVIVRPGPHLDPRFISYYLNSAASHHISSHLVGAVQQHFNVASARALTLLLPPLEEQARIGSALGTLDDKIALICRMNQTLEDMARAIFKSSFVCQANPPHESSPKLPPGCKNSHFGKLATSQRRNIEPNASIEDVAYIGLEHMPRRSIALDQWESSQGLASSKLRFFRGEILFGKLRPYFHKVGVAPIDGICSTDILVLSPTSPQFWGLVLGYASSDDFVSYADRASVGTKMPRARWEDIAKFPVVVPSDPAAQDLTNKLSPLVDLIISNIHQSRTLAALRDTLLPKLLSGEIRIKQAEKMVGEAV